MALPLYGTALKTARHESAPVLLTATEVPLQRADIGPGVPDDRDPAERPRQTDRPPRHQPTQLYDRHKFINIKAKIRGILSCI